MAAPDPFSDIVIAGAGIAGASFALTVKRALGALVSVTLCDPDLTSFEDEAPRRSMRAVALAPDGRSFLETLGIWPMVADAAQPILGMTITDSRPGALPHPVYLGFEGHDLPDGVLAHMVFADDLRGALLRACRAAGVVFEPTSLDGFRAERHGVSVALPANRRLRARLLVAADGSRSRLRHAAGIQSFGRPYRQSGIVATLRHTESHEGRAIQHFLPAGPLALLPLKADDGSPHRTSIVWTEATDAAERLAALPDADFLAALQDRVGVSHGQLALEDRPKSFPLRLALARRLRAPRLALIGDAARVIHPLAGQGLNLGLRDAEALATRVEAAAALGLDPGSEGVLAAYARDRQFDAAAMAAATDLMNRLFSNDRLPVRVLRDIGLGLVDRAPALKRRFMGGATGLAMSSARTDPEGGIRRP